MRIRFEDLYKLIEDGELLSIAINDYVYYEDGTVYHFIKEGEVVVERKESDEDFEKVCKRYFDCYVTYLNSGIDGGICVGLED